MAVDPATIRVGATYRFHGMLVRVMRIGKPKLRSDGQYHRSVEWTEALTPRADNPKFNRLGTFARRAIEDISHAD